MAMNTLVDQQDTMRELERLLELEHDVRKKIDIVRDFFVRLYRNSTKYAFLCVEKEKKYAEMLGDKELIATSYWHSGICWSFVENPLRALEEYQVAYKLYREIGREAGASQVLRLMGTCHMLMGEVQKALYMFTECKEYFSAQKNLMQEAVAATYLAELMLMTGHYQQALEQILYVCKIHEEQNTPLDRKQLQGCYRIRAKIYRHLQYFELEHEFLLKFLESSTENQSRLSIGLALSMLAGWHIRHDRISEAMHYLEQAHQVQDQPEAYYAGYWAELYEQKGEWEKAIEKYLEVLAHNAVTNNQLYQENNYIAIGRCYIHVGKPREAVSYLDKVIEKAIEYDNKTWQSRIYQYLSEAYQLLGDTSRAFEYYRCSAEVKESLLNEEKQRIVAEIQAKFDVESAEREKELFRVKNTELADALDEVQRLNDDLTSLNSEKSEVLSVVAHDLKSPLAGVRMVASLLKAHYRQMPQDELEQQLDTIIDSTDRMLSIASNLLNTGQIETEEAFGTLEHMNVFPFVEQLAGSYIQAARDKQIRIEVAGGECTALCSREALRQIVENLLGNAIKFSPHGRTVRIRVGSRGRRVRIEIEDEGPGISKAERGKLYRKYSRLSARPTGGESTTGLGLWITKKAVEAMQGQIRCLSRPGKTIFRVELSKA